jgi:hypothetical protein
MFFLEVIAERKIAEAIERGELSNLPGEGTPLDLDNDRLVPEDLRMAYRILRNAGFVPAEVSDLREIGELERFLETAEGEARGAALKKLQVLRMRLELRADGFRSGRTYFTRLLARLA